MGTEKDKRCDSPAPRRTFLKHGLITIAGLAASGAIPADALASEAPDNPLLKPSQPWKSQRVLKSESVGEALRQQHYLESEIVGSNGVKMISKVYTKRTELADTYDLLTIVVNEHFVNATDVKPQETLTFTSSITGIKGSVDGDYRLDTLNITAISPDGVSSEGPKQVRILLKDPTLGMSDQERMNWMLNRKKGAA